MKLFFNTIFANIIIILLISSCSVTKNIGKDDSLLVHNKFYINDERAIDVSEYKRVITTNENNKLIFTSFPLEVYIYQHIDNTPSESFDSLLSKNPKKTKLMETIFSKKSVHKLKNQYVSLNSIIKENFSQKPVLLDKEKALVSSKNLENLFISKGYLDAISFVDIVTEDKKSTLNYKIYTGSRYKIDSIYLNTEYSEIKHLYSRYMRDVTLNKYILNDDKYLDFSEILEMRQSLATYFKDNGIYNFNVNNITFGLDTLNTEKEKVDLYISIAKKNDSPLDSTISYHDIYKISEIKILINADSISEKNDTLSYENYLIISSKTKKYSPRVITNQILLSTGDPYSNYKEKRSKFLLNRTNNFNFTTIKFTPDTVSKTLSTEINMVSNPKYWINYELGVSRSYLLEFGIDISFVNGIKNLVSMADVFETSVTGSVGSYRGVSTGGNFLSSYLINFSVKWRFPIFLFPFEQKIGYAKRINPRTDFSLSYDIQKNIGLDRKKMTFGAKFTWNENDFKEHSITLPKLDYTEYLNPENYFDFYLTEKAKVDAIYENVMGSEVPENSNYEQIIIDLLENPNTSSEELKTLLDINNRYDIFTSNLFNMSLEYSFTYNNKLNESNWLYFKTTIETSGNLVIPLLEKLNLLEKNPLYKTPSIFGVPTSKYLKFEFNLIKYWKLFGNYSKLASRLFVGVGIPLGDTYTMPYEKMYFGGGTNFERAWLVYDLGPGGNTEKIFSLNVADIKISFSLEYRYTIYKSIKGGLFVDIGNIWRVNSIYEDSENDLNDLEVFDFKRFYKEFSVGIGNGFRYDLDFFVLRLDFAYKMFDPAMEEGKRFVLLQQKFLSPTLQFGITYPF